MRPEACSSRRPCSKPLCSEAAGVGRETTTPATDKLHPPYGGDTALIRVYGHPGQPETARKESGTSMNPVTASSFTLGDLLDCTELGLALATGDERARERVIAGAHCIELRRPAQWLEPDWVMLTTGLELKDSHRAQRELSGGSLRAGRHRMSAFDRRVRLGGDLQRNECDMPRRYGIARHRRRYRV